MSTLELVRQRLEEMTAIHLRLQNDDVAAAIGEVAKAMLRSYRQGRKAIVFGNGGSAADAQHIVAELLGKFCLDRPPLPAVALTVNTSSLTAIANDFGYADVFRRQLEAIGEANDVAIGLSTSGNSENVLCALQTARDRHLVTVALTGQDGGRMKDVARYCLRVPSDSTPRIQEMHIAIGHLLCEIVERGLFGEAGSTT